MKSSLNYSQFTRCQIRYLEHKKDPEPAENDEDAEDEGEGNHGDQVEEGGQVQVQAAPKHYVGNQGGTLNMNIGFRFMYQKNTI